MQRILPYFLFTAVLFPSCEKVIDINLEGAEKKYVIEGVITNLPGDCKVSVSQTKDFDEDNDFHGLSGASVSITDNSSGTAAVLSETSPGIYETGSLTGVPGTSYTLRVTIGEESFTASSTMPQQVNMDTVYVTDENIFGETWKLANVKFPDPAGVENRYRYVQ
ncbi:MAG TPA: DUF4249 family protein, partial [Anseongella sp.]|nr:DUF4249 family protein [Anseongella sp.]